MESVFVTPSENARVRMPERSSNVMPAEGGWIQRSVHYERLIQSGDLIVADPQPPLPQNVPDQPVAKAAPTRAEPDLSRSGIASQAGEKNTSPRR